MLRVPPTVTIVLCLFLSTTLTGQTVETRSGNDELLAAELKELTEGDLPAAMEVYERLHADTTQSEEVRARALLYLARCQRKVGALTEAKRLLEDLVRNHAAQKSIVEQADSFLAELVAGRATNPEFDWLRRMQDTPQIQARIFELCMDLVNPGSPEGVSASKQLVALGPLATSMIERVRENSADARHRSHLALILVQIGRLDHFAGVLRVANESDATLGARLAAYLQETEHMPDSTRQAALVALDELPKEGISPMMSSVVRLWIGDDTRVAENLVNAEAYYDMVWNHASELELEEAQIIQNAIIPVDLLTQLARTERGRAGIVARIQATPASSFRSTFLKVLESVGALPDELMGAVLLYGQWDTATAMLRRIERDTPRFLVELARQDPHAYAPGLGGYYHKEYLGKAATPPPSHWGEILFLLSTVPRTGARDRLYALAKGDDSAVPWFIRSLEAWAEGDQERRALNRAHPNARHRSYPSWSPSRFYQSQENWTLSAAFASALKDCLDSDPYIQQFALRTLLVHDAPLSEREFDGMRSLLRHAKHLRDASGSPVDRHAIRAITNTLKRGGVNTAAVLRFCGTVLEGDDEDTAWTIANEIGDTFRETSAPRDLLLRGIEPIVTNPAVPKKLRDSILGSALRHMQGQADPQVMASILERFGRTVESALHSSIAAWIIDPHSREHVEPLVRDIILSGQGRWDTEGILSSLTLQGHYQVILDWISIEDHLVDPNPPFPLISYDPKPCASAVRKHIEKNYSPARQDAVYEAILDHPDADLRSTFARTRGIWPQRPGGYTVWLQDPELGIRHFAATMICKQTDSSALPQILQVLERPETELKLMAIHALGSMASLDSLEPLGALIDHTDFRIRNAAIEALRSIRDTLDQTEEWKELLDELREAREAKRGERR